MGGTRGITRRGRAERSEEALERDFPFIGVGIGTSEMTIVSVPHQGGGFASQ